ncbi:hypothetical protein C8F01DRAFT_976171 [Mycena amicta]|nr:hypothetical protein C8F01DRAFT_976171 [Mycena amicta]
MPPSITLTLTVPDGTSNHGDPSLLCTPTHWTSILAFFLGNYIAHAATTLSYPGEEFGEYAQAIVIALLFPTAGVIRGLDAIVRCAIFATSDLMCAARAGALCMLIRIETPRPRHSLRLSEDSDATNPNAKYPHWMKERHHFYWRFIEAPCSMRKIHGVQKALLPLGYDFAIVPRDAIVLPSQPVAGATSPQGQDANAKPIVISASRSAARAVVAIVQTCYGAFTLYRTSGDQIARYGYAAFGLTVAPYTVMSIVNLLGSVLTPSYPTMYLVRSEVMDEIDHRFGRDGRPYFDGTVGVLETVEPETRADVGEHTISLPVEEGLNAECTPPPPVVLACREFRRLQDGKPAKHPSREESDPLISDTQFCMIAGISVGIPLAIIGGLTKFHPGDSSTHAQRVWLMTWLGFSFIGAFSIYVQNQGYLFDALIQRTVKRLPFFTARSLCMSRFPMFSLALMLVYSAPAIGGLVVVAEMLKVYGDCVHL